jgi:hypothetical protein
LLGASLSSGLAVLTVICTRQTFPSGIGPHHVLLVETEAAAVPVNQKSRFPQAEAFSFSS